VQVLCGDGITKELSELSPLAHSTRAIQIDRLLTRGVDRLSSIRIHPRVNSPASLFSRASPVLITAYPPTPRRHFITVRANLARSKCQLRERVRQAVLSSPSRPSAVSLGFFYFRERRTEDRSATPASFKETH